MPDIDLVFLDIDGTIFHQGALIDSAISAISTLQKNGTKVAICTGRSVIHAASVQAALKLPYAVYFNGGLVHIDGQAVFSTPLATEVSRRIAEYCDEYHLGLILHSEWDAMILDPIPPQYDSLLNQYDYPSLKTITKTEWQTYSHSIFQVNVFLPETWDDEIATTFPECLLYRWDDQAIDLQKRGSDKAIGAKALLTQLDIDPSRTVHIGDGGNDLGMFRLVGTAIAMGNASAEVQAQADWSTASVTNDGVHKALQKLGLLS